jgi:hypothetical protein
MRRKNSSSTAKPVDGTNHRSGVQANFAVMETDTQNQAFTRPFPSNIEIGRRMRAARKKRGWTIAEMAASRKDCGGSNWLLRTGIAEHADFSVG